MMPWMMCEGVYQSVRCWEFSALCTTPCQSLTAPQVQIGSRPIARSARATHATRAAAMARCAPRRSAAGSVRVAAGIPVARSSNAGIHATGVENARGVEGRLDPGRDTHDRVRLRLENVHGGAHLRRGAQEGGVAPGL